MKKTLWGYNIPEVDETVGYLETQIVKLERQVKQLNAELEKTKTELEETNIVSEYSHNSDIDALVAELRQKLEDAEKTNKILSLENEGLSAKINEISAKVTDTDPFENIGSICKQAYTDIHTSRQKAKEGIEDFLKKFWDEWKKYELQLTELSQKLNEKQQNSREAFISYADYILKVYSDIEESNESLGAKFAELNDTKANVELRLNDILSELDDDFETEGNVQTTEITEELPAEPEQPENPNSILSAIKKLKQQDEITQKNEEKMQEIHTAETHIKDVSKDEINISQKVNISNII